MNGLEQKQTRQLMSHQVNYTLQYLVTYPMKLERHS